MKYKFGKGLKNAPPDTYCVMGYHQNVFLQNTHISYTTTTVIIKVKNSMFGYFP